MMRSEQGSESKSAEVKTYTSVPGGKFSAEEYREHENRVPRKGKMGHSKTRVLPAL